MASSNYITKAGTKLFQKHLDQYAPADPLYESYTDNRGREKRRKRPVPPGLSPRDAKILKSVQRRAHYLDKGFSVCGFRFGWTFIIGIIPGAGDVADVSLNYILVVRKARQADLPAWLVRRMLLNNAVSAISGLVPVVGDVVLAMYKANSRNAALLEEFLRIRGEEFLRLQAERNEAAQNKEQEHSESAPIKHDIDQVKPGSGIPDEPKAKGKSISWRGSKRDKQKAEGSQEGKDRGKFIEDVVSGPGPSAESGSGTLKKQKT
ncbi:hypothetical protein SERLADRAFT_468764 [Serpula lacrymans var. lacrymans S7.9]|uniref:DUF4112 domain-containing protein n=1 Tax=Serpula lacrymans var. lacrymans (strain S7.9) TaxID=578457 RepID=F8NVL3_SERL9|nr:uncharacterized protein SERLADRAFT_468764 [Serpula lacrymans var. lacrymans S7.9]EGO24851.1 hypothetical protein SERLADRAFT_468764 [Serpula lacrymans var. lacrymans S7.9]